MPSIQSSLISLTFLTSWLLILNFENKPFLSERLPNINYLELGYNIYRGNPKEFGSKVEIDPEFSPEAIFNLSVDGGITPRWSLHFTKRGLCS